ncbi:M36 family metallopeptidase, partial [Desulfosarcina sp.]|nr:M36 family metallopeptidase [Desulfosarcina sp.]
GWHDVDGVVGAEYTITRGNNVLAQLDEDGNDGDGYSPDGSATLSFDYTLDFDQQPIGYKDAAVTNLFYMNNMMHDIWFNYGFDEQSGNFQEKNYTGPPLTEGDAVNADAQDGGGIGNANFGTPPDGSSPRMQMYLWSPADGDILTINNGTLSGTYVGAAAGFGDQLPEPPLTADLGLLVDSQGDDVNDGCELVPFSLAGKIAVIRRGNCEFGFKVSNAETMGAIAAIVVNNEPGGAFSMSPGEDGDGVAIPSIMVNQTDGEAIIAALINGETISASLISPIYIDGDFDNGVIAHEYGHGISNRLTGGAATADCLSNQEQMGEGWSDWFGLMVTMESSDKATDVRGIGTFALDQDTDGQGIRTQQYSTDKAVNNFTFADSNTQVVPHGVGSVWATMLWDLTWAYIDKYGFDADLYNGTGGNNKAMELVIKGLMLQACNPGFIDGRNAVLAADFDLTGGENQCIIWEVFAARGLGFAADQGDSSSSNDQTEDYTVPNESDVIGAGLPTLANCQALSTRGFNTKDYKIYPNPTNGKLIIKTTKSFGDAVITLSDINGRLVLSQKAILLGEVELNVSTLQSGIYILNIKGQYINAIEKIIKN